MLTDTAIKRAPRSNKPYRLNDDRGLYLIVNPNGSRWWRFSYTFAGKRNNLSLGVYPDTGLSDARLRRDDIRRFIAQGIDPAAQRKADRTASTERATNSFEVVAREWLGVKAHEWVPAHLAKETLRLEKHAFPWIGNKPMSDLGVDDVLPLIKRVFAAGHLEQAHRLRECHDIAAMIGGADALLVDTRADSDDQQSASRLLFNARERLMKL